MPPMPATAMAVTALTGRRSRVRINLVVGVPQGLIGLHDLAGLLLGAAAAFLPVCAADRSLGRVGTDPRRRP